MALRGFDSGAETPQEIDDLVACCFDLALGNFTGVQITAERDPRGITHPREDARGTSELVEPENDSLGFVPIDHHHRLRGPFRMATQKQLQRQGREINTSRPVHGTSPGGSSRAPVACL